MAISAEQSDNVRLLQRVYDVWHAPDKTAVLELLDPEFEYVNPPNAVEPGTRRGHEGFAAVVANLESTFAVQTHDLGEVQDLGDSRVLWHTVFRARGHSGAQIEVPEQHLWTLRDGKVLRLQWFHDADEACSAAGIREPPPAPPELPLADRLRAGYSVWNASGDIAPVLTELDPDVELVISERGPEGRLVFHGHDGFVEWARGMQDVWSDLTFEPIEVEADEARRRAIVIVRVSSTGRLSEAAVESAEAHVHTLGADGKVVRIHAFSDPEQARAAFDAV